MSHVAEGVVRISNLGPPQSDDVPLAEHLGESKYQIRFQVMPQIGQRVRWGYYTWIVTDVFFAVDRNEDGVLNTGIAKVDFELLHEASCLIGTGGSIIARVLFEQFLDDENGDYEGQLVALSTLPLPGHEFIDATRDGCPRYVVKTVTHIMDREAGSLPQIVVALDPTWKPTPMKDEGDAGE